MKPSIRDLEILVLAPFGRDAAAAVEVLAEVGIQARPFLTVEDLCLRLKDPAGAVLVAEEALTHENSSELKVILDRQETWSSIPIILMASKSDRIFSTEKIMQTFEASGAFTILERPFRILTLVASVRVALHNRQRQYQVRELLRQQINSLRQRDEFLSIASHELRTPMTSLKVQVQLRKRLLKRGDQSVFEPDKVISLIESTDKQIDRLSRLVDDMLDISRIVNGKLTLNIEHVELGKLTKEVLENFLPQFEAAGCEVEIKNPAPVYVDCDRYRIEQVIVNLLTNSIKYGKASPVSIQITSKDNEALLLVKDRGMGIADEDQERIFMRFERVVEGSGIGGLGLGLYITRQILDLHKGEISVTSKLGEGSTFMVKLPLSPSQEQNAV